MGGSIVRKLAVLVVLLTLAGAAPPPAAGDAVTIRNYLPYGLALSSLVFDGTHAYLLGGWSCAQGGCDAIEAFQEAILRYDPANGQTTRMNAELWLGNAGSAAVWSPESGRAILFGGFRCLAPSLTGCDSAQEIFTYTPATDSIQVVLGVLPTPRAYASAVWTGEHAYIFGGWDGGTADYDQILKYDPALDTVTPMTARLPVPLGEGRYAMASVWTGQHAYLFGGITAGGYQVDILRYDPALDRLDVMGARLPAGIARAAAFFDGRYAYVVGGAITSSSFGSDLVVRYDTLTDTAVTMAARLPSGREGPAAFWDPTPRAVNGCLAGCGHVLGGMQVDQILRYTLEPGAPRTVDAEWGPGPGNGTVTWVAPAANTRSHDVAAYRVYRGVDGGPKTLRATLPGTALSYLDTGLDPQRSYQYMMTAETAAGIGPLSAEAILQPPLPPSAPREFVAFKGDGPGRLSMRWEPPADDGGAPIEGYLIERATTANGPFSLLATVAGATLAYTDTGLGNGVTRHYRVAALNVAGDGARSPARAATTATPPEAPRDVSARPDPLDPDSVVLSWTPRRDGGLPFTAWRIYRGFGLEATTLVAEVPVPLFGYRDADLDPGVYTWAVVAVNAAGASPPSTGATMVAAGLS